jgi:phage tail sheath protein FI
VYHPRLLVPDPLGEVTAPLRCVPPSGHVAGVISRLDAQRGSYYTPANAPIYQAVDLSQRLDASQEAVLYQGGINLLRCSPGQGLLVWGGRALGPTPLGPFVAHRRLIHLLLRAIHRVAEPLVFDTNGPTLWLAFVRSITSVLLEAFRAGALKGATPDQAFRVICDATTNPPEQIDNGIVVCIVQVAPAVPMEFITLRVAVSAQGQLEVFES